MGFYWPCADRNYVRPDKNLSKISEGIRFGDCSAITTPSWNVLLEDLEIIQITFAADECGFLIATEPNISYQTTLHISHSGKALKNIGLTCSRLEVFTIDPVHDI